MKRKSIKIITNIGITAASFVLTYAIIIAGVKQYAKHLNIKSPPFRYENSLDLWDPDPLTGYINKPGFSGYSFGNVSVRTNSLGFRGIKPVAVSRADNVSRIIGIGDSVMWGVGVNLEDSFLGSLSKKLNKDAPFEVINAGVIGYSTYQEMMFLEKFALPLKPDIVLVNYCSNDFLPSEDPFKNARSLFIEYFRDLLSRQDITFTQDEKLYIEKHIDIFGNAEHVWLSLQKLWDSQPELFYLKMKIFLKMPIERMVKRCQNENVRLIYLFIPPSDLRDQYKKNTDQLKKVLLENGAEFIDVQSVLVPDKELLAEKRFRSRPILKHLRPKELTDVIKMIMIRRVHQRDMFIDSCHPTIKGNKIIAEHIYQYLTRTAPENAKQS